MTDEIVTSPDVGQTAARQIPRPAGRKVDRIAMGLAGLGTVLGLTAAIWFFAGFAENDQRPEGLASALVLTLLLFVFAIVPFALVTRFAQRAYRLGAKRAHLFWTLFLMVPWTALAMAAIVFTPLPVWCSALATLISGLLVFWALISLILDRRTEYLNSTE